MKRNHLPVLTTDLHALNYNLTVRQIKRRVNRAVTSNTSVTRRL